MFLVLILRPVTALLHDSGQVTASVMRGGWFKNSYSRVGDGVAVPGVRDQTGPACLQPNAVEAHYSQSLVLRFLREALKMGRLNSDYLDPCSSLAWKHLCNT